MSSAGFPINDLLRRKLQTGITVTTLTLSVASTLFLLLFTNRLGLGMTSTTSILTVGLAATFRQFILFVGILIFVVGAVLSSFIVFLMMAQRTRDFGLIKAAGCPNSLVAGYFTTELLIVTFVSCVLGILFGFLGDFAVARIVFSSYQVPNFLFAPLVFVAFVILALFFGLQPILKASRMSPIEALSPASYYGLTIGAEHRALPRSSLTWRIATRSLIRRQSATIRIVILLSIVFVLLTVSIAGGIIANNTTTSWVQKTVSSDTIAVAHSSMGNQYKLLLSMFSGAKGTNDFNYSDPGLAISNTAIAQIRAFSKVSLVDSRLVLLENVKEVGNFTVISGTTNEIFVGDSREGKSLVVGIDPTSLVSEWAVQGRFLSGTDDSKAVIGDSISQSVYYPNLNRDVVLSDPLVEGIRFQNTTFDIVGICIDPINNGYVTYVPLDSLKNATGIANPNILLVKLDGSIDRNIAIEEVRNIIQASGQDLDVFDLSAVTSQNTGLLASTWQTIMFLPLLTLASASLCLVGYMMLSVDEQHQELAVLRAVGAKPKIAVFILAIQSLIVLISSFAVGTSIGTIVTLVILMKQPLVTSLTILEISGWFIVALVGVFILSLYPAFRVARASILKIIT
jgi:ABC-type antimicrobial peptide transport system permease subunit